MFNASIVLDPHSYSKSAEETIYMSSDTVGDCMVGVKGKLYSVMELTQEILNLKSRILMAFCIKIRWKEVGQRMQGNFAFIECHL